MNIKPNVDIQLSDLKLALGPELRVVYPLILNFAVSGELELSGPAHPKLIQPRGILTFENGDVNLVATQVSSFISFILVVQGIFSSSGEFKLTHILLAVSLFFALVLSIDLMNFPIAGEAQARASEYCKI